MGYVKIGRPPQNGNKNHNFKHGGKGTRLYNIWKGLKKRCYGSTVGDKYYRLKGIRICIAWSMFENFRDWALANGYSDKLSIDRRNGDKGYSPKNCRWADRVTQNNNTSRNVFYNVNGKKLTLSQISRSTGIHAQTLHSRLHKLNWPIERAIQR